MTTTTTTRTLFVNPYLHDGRWFAVLYGATSAPVLTPEFGTVDALEAYIRREYSEVQDKRWTYTQVPPWA
jgi:hypothetical protein